MTNIGHQLFYIGVACYTSSTAIVKLSLLVQYLRVFREGRMRTICLWLLALTVLWSVAVVYASCVSCPLLICADQTHYRFMAWFPCFPVQASWDTTILDKQCYFFGAKDDSFEFAASYVSHAASNMTLDLIILLLPTALYFQRDMTRKEIWGVSWLISMGAM